MGVLCLVNWIDSVDALRAGLELTEALRHNPPPSSKDQHRSRKPMSRPVTGTAMLALVAAAVGALFGIVTS